MSTSSDALVDRARDQAGFEDLGTDPWQLGFDRLLDAIDDELRDDPVTVGHVEALLVERLVQRLRVEDWYAQHGEEASHPVERPVVVVGLPRTATTAVHHLLSLDDQFRYLRSWELKDPVPPPDAATEHDDPRRPSEARVDVRHIVTVDGPAEDSPIHALAFDHAELTLPVPSYSVWWRTRDHTAVFEYHERILRLLHSRRPPRTWLLKMPAYVFLLDEMAEHYPTATFVMTHRDPVTALASTCSTVADARQKRTPTWRPGPEFGHQQLEHWVDGMRRAMASRDSLGEHRFVDVAQHELEADPVGTAERIYERASRPLAGEVADSMAAWADANRRGSRGRHHYDLADYGLTAAEVTAAFEPYLARYGDRLGSA